MTPPTPAEALARALLRGGAGMSGLRTFGVIVFRNALWAPMVSLGLHLDLHTPTLDLHLPFFTVQIGRNSWLGKRFEYLPAEHRWNGHSDNCDHQREQLP